MEQIIIFPEVVSYLENEKLGMSVNKGLETCITKQSIFTFLLIDSLFNSNNSGSFIYERHCVGH